MLRKHSFTLKGHRTSVSLEDPFWDALKAEAAARGQSLAKLVEVIDEARDEKTNLSSALRVFALKRNQQA